MTYKEWKEKQSEVNELCKEGKITKDDKGSFEKVMEYLYGKCLDCRSNDGCPHGECWSCDD